MASDFDFDFVRPGRPIQARLVAGRGHYEAVVQAVMNAERSVWIATANLKELMVEDARARPGKRRSARPGKGEGEYRSILVTFEELVRRGVEIRILHASPPSGPFREELRRRRGLAQAGTAEAAAIRPLVRGSFELRACPRVHLKAVIVDGAEIYLGSANWTGAGLGAKGAGRRNFELGLLSRDDLLLDEVQALYDRIWGGLACRGCKRRDVCSKPLDGGPGVAGTALRVGKGMATGEGKARTGRSPARRTQRVGP